MTMPLPLSIFIITKNEGKRLQKTLHAIRGLADEIIIIDSGSTDNTCEIAKQYGARIIINTPFPGYGQQKRFAEDHCRNDWLLNIDADERMTSELYNEIIRLFSKPRHLKNFYSIKIVDILPHETKPSIFAYSKYPIRLYKRTAGRFSASSIHDSVISHEKIGKIKAPLLHHSILTLSQVINKFSSYTHLQSQDYVLQKRKIHQLRLLFEFPFAFFKAYILRKYIFRGINGYLFSIIYASYRLIRLIKIKDAQHKTMNKIEDINEK